MMTASDIQVEISGAHSIGSPLLMNGSSFTCIAWKTSFTSDEGEDERDAVVQVAQAIEQVAQQEVQLAQAHEREDVRREDDERALA